MRSIPFLALLSLFSSSSVVLAGPYEDGFRAGFADGYARGQQSCQPIPPQAVTCQMTMPEVWFVNAQGTTAMCNNGFGSRTYKGTGSSRREALAEFLRSCNSDAKTDCCDAAIGGYPLRGANNEQVWLRMTCY